jgi:hypothetical protein
MRKTTYAAFLSFADPDRELVEAIHDLFSLMDVNTFFAPKALPEAGSPAWRNAIIKGIHQSRYFIPIYSRHSINRPWVLYESGLADSIGLPRFPARVAGVDISEIEYLPNPGAQVYSLFDKKSLVDLIVNICATKGSNKSEIAAKAHNVVNTSEFTGRIINLSKIRWVFIAGNVPNDETILRSQVPHFTSMQDYTTRLETFVDKLTEHLLGAGFSVAACLQVPSVGFQVIKSAANLLETKKYTQHVDYRISGTYPIDRDARQASLSVTAKQKWLSHIMDFRKSYLKDQEWLLTIGGSQGTMEEYMAARQCRVKVLSVPCFGGSSHNIWETNEAARGGPCKECQHNTGTCTDDRIKEIVSYLKRTSA